MTPQKDVFTRPPLVVEEVVTLSHTSANYNVYSVFTNVYKLEYYHEGNVDKIFVVNDVLYMFI